MAVAAKSRAAIAEARDDVHAAVTEVEMDASSVAVAGGEEQQLESVRAICRMSNELGTTLLDKLSQIMKSIKILLCACFGMMEGRCETISLRPSR